MFENMDIGLKAKLKEFMKKFGIDSSVVKDKIFENFGNYVVVSNIIKKDFKDINKISTNGAHGIDGIAICINGRLILEPQDLNRLGEDEKLKVEIVFVQSTLRSSFDSQKFSSFVDCVVDFLIGKLKINPFSEILDELLNEDNNYIDNLVETPKISLYFLSGKTSHTLDSDFISSQKNKITSREDLKDKFRLNDIYFWQKDEIKSAYDRIPEYHKVNLKLYRNIQLESKPDIEISLLAAIKFSGLKKLILNTEGSLKEELFVENPRFYLRGTSVNLDIKNTLDDHNLRPYFIYLNNGLTILCDAIERHPIQQDIFTLIYPRIINGCQTTHILYEKYVEDPDTLEDLEIIAKIIATKNKKMKEAIIFAANNQNAIDKDLQALNEFHKKIE